MAKFKKYIIIVSSVDDARKLKGRIQGWFKSKKFRATISVRIHMKDEQIAVSTEVFFIGIDSDIAPKIKAVKAYMEKAEAKINQNDTKG